MLSDGLVKPKESSPEIDLACRKIKYATYSKDSLQKSITDLESWYTRWDPSWFMIARLASPNIDAEIRQQRLKGSPTTRQPLTIVGDLRNAHRANADKAHHSFELLPEGVRLYLSSPIAFSTAMLSTRSDSHAVVVVDTIQYRPETNEADISHDVQSLARILSKLDPLTCNLLTCDGVKKNMDGNGKLQSFSFLFRMPPMGQETSGSSGTLRGNAETDIVVGVMLSTWLRFSRLITSSSKPSAAYEIYCFAILVRYHSHAAW